MTNLKQFKESELKSEIIDQFGSISNMIKHLKKNAVDSYGCMTNDILVGGCKITYTSNPNCYANVLVQIKGVGMACDYALNYDCITKVGIMRLGYSVHSHHLNIK